jgi:hypothetical protein
MGILFLWRRTSRSSLPYILYNLRWDRAQSRQSATVGFFSSRQNWDLRPCPHLQASVFPTFGSGGDTLVCGREWGGPKSEEGKDTLVLLVTSHM